jgi:hypothetical protein
MPQPFGPRDPSPLIRERQLAQRWDKSIRFLQRLRRGKAGPPWLRIGGSVYYRVEDIVAFELALRQGGEE